jgi:riboflavin transporter FmnP
MRTAHIAYLVLGLVAALGAGLLALEAARLLTAARPLSTPIGAIAGALAYIAFVCGRMGTSNFRL